MEFTRRVQDQTSKRHHTNTLRKPWMQNLCIATFLHISAGINSCNNLILIKFYLNFRKHKMESMLDNTPSSTKVKKEDKI